MTSTHELIKQLGRREVMKRVDASDQAMTNAIKRGLPSKWYVAIKALADERGVQCPPELFGMVGVSSDADDAA